MSNLIDFEVLTNETFYKGWHILEYIEKKKLTPLDIEAIKATIMDALVYKGLINPEEEFLNLETLSITNNPNDYHYNKTPNVSGIPMHIKEQLRHISIHQSAGLPVMLFIAKPPSKIGYCVYDPNYSVSSIFNDVNFLEVIYDSPTRPGVRLTETRPFIEVEINGGMYLVDTITNRVFKSSWFTKTYNMDIKSSLSKKDFNQKQKESYKEITKPEYNLANSMFVYDMLLSLPSEDLAETRYEVEQAQKNYPDQAEEARRLNEEMQAHFAKYPRQNK